VLAVHPLFSYARAQELGVQLFEHFRQYTHTSNRLWHKSMELNSAAGSISAPSATGSAAAAITVQCRVSMAKRNDYGVRFVRNTMYRQMVKFSHPDWDGKEGPDGSCPRPTKSPFPCWNCLHYFQGAPFTIPMEALNKTMSEYGNFCSPPCGNTFLHFFLPDALTNERASLLFIHARDNYGWTGNTIGFAPLFWQHQRFGGTMDDSQFQMVINTPELTVSLLAPPYIPAQMVEEWEMAGDADTQGLPAAAHLAIPCHPTPSFPKGGAVYGSGIPSETIFGVKGASSAHEDSQLLVADSTGANGIGSSVTLNLRNDVVCMTGAVDHAQDPIPDPEVKQRLDECTQVVPIVVDPKLQTKKKHVPVPAMVALFKGGFVDEKGVTRRGCEDNRQQTCTSESGSGGATSSAVAQASAVLNTDKTPQQECVNSTKRVRNRASAAGAAAAPAVVVPCDDGVTIPIAGAKSLRVSAESALAVIMGCPRPVDSAAENRLETRHLRQPSLQENLERIRNLPPQEKTVGLYDLYCSATDICAPVVEADARASTVDARHEHDPSSLCHDVPSSGATKANKKKRGRATQATSSNDDGGAPDPSPAPIKQRRARSKKSNTTTTTTGSGGGAASSLLESLQC
jgi:hypothetical protein